MDTIGEKLLYTLSAKNAISSVLAEAQIEVPQAFGDYAAVISSNIGTPVETASDVEFIDYDGRTLHKYTFEEAAALTALPDLPTRSGFTNEGWNYTLAELTAAASEEKHTIVGCTYITDDDITRIYVTIPADSLTLSIAFSQLERTSLLFDWGDGTTDTPGNPAQATRTHTYQQAGDYVVSFTPLKEYATLILGGNIGGSGAAANNQKITDVAIGKIKSISSYVFSECDNLSAVSIPKDATIGSHCFDGMTKLKAFVLPRTATFIPEYMFRFCGHLKKLSVPPTTTEVGQYAFYGCSELVELYLTDVSTLGPYAFQRCSELKKVVAKNVTAIPFYCFNNCGSLEIVDTAPLSAIMGNSFYGCEALESINANRIVSFGSGTNNFAYCIDLKELGTLAIQADSDNNNRPTIGQNCFTECKSLHTLVVEPEDTLSSLFIGQNAFSQSGITTFDFSGCTRIAELASTNAFTGTPTDKKILVPAALESDWKTQSSNWVSFAGNIVGV